MGNEQILNEIIEEKRFEQEASKMAATDYAKPPAKPCIDDEIAKRQREINLLEAEKFRERGLSPEATQRKKDTLRRMVERHIKEKRLSQQAIELASAQNSRRGPGGRMIYGG